MTGNIVKPMKKYIYLGATLKSKLKWNGNIHSVVSKANNKLLLKIHSLKLADSAKKLFPSASFIGYSPEYANLEWYAHTSEEIKKL